MNERAFPHLLRSTVLGVLGLTAACGSRTELPIDAEVDGVATSDDGGTIPCTFTEDQTKAADCSSVIKVSPGVRACGYPAPFASVRLCEAACGRGTSCALIHDHTVTCLPCERRPAG